MSRTIASAARTPNTVTSAFVRLSAPFLTIPYRLWQRLRYRAGLRAILPMGPRLIADFGMTMEAAEQEVDPRFWQSPYVPPLRHF